MENIMCGILVESSINHTVKYVIRYFPAYEANHTIPYQDAEMRHFVFLVCLICPACSARLKILEISLNSTGAVLSRTRSSKAKIRVSSSVVLHYSTCTNSILSQ